MATATLGTRQKAINSMTPAAQKAKLGDVVADLTAQLNTLTTKYNALLAHLDVGNVTGIGNTNVTTYGAPTATVVSMEQR